MSLFFLGGQGQVHDRVTPTSSEPDQRGHGSSAKQLIKEREEGCEHPEREQEPVHALS